MITSPLSSALRRLVPSLVGVLSLAACAIAAPATVSSVASPSAAAQSAEQSTAGAPTDTSASPSSASTTTSSPPAAPAKPAAAKSCGTPPASFVHAAPGKGKTVALTFDDGPAPADAKIAAILQKYGVHATFFLTGAHTAADPATVKLLSEQGNLIADHSYDHDYPSQVTGGWSVAYLTAQLAKTNSTLTDITGQAVCFFRPPGGYTTNVLAAAGKLNMTSALWSVDSEDWQQPDATTSAATATIVTNATKASGQTHPVVLMHSGKASHEPDSKVSPNRGNTIAALPTIIEWYKAQGYTFVRMDGVK